MAEMSPDSQWPLGLYKGTVQYCSLCSVFKDSDVLVPPQDLAPKCECGGPTGASEEEEQLQGQVSPGVSLLALSLTCQGSGKRWLPRACL